MDSRNSAKYIVTLSPLDSLESKTPRASITVFEVEHSIDFVPQTALALSGYDCVLYECVGGTELERDYARDVINAIISNQYSDAELLQVLNDGNFILHLAYELRGKDILFLPIDIIESDVSPAWQAHEKEVAMGATLGSLTEALDVPGITSNILAQYIIQRARTQVLREETTTRDIETIIKAIQRNTVLNTSMGAVAVIVGKAHKSVYKNLLDRHPSASRQLIP